MAKLLDVNKSAYIDSNIAIYAQNKLGQYSKFLNKNPIFVTYYSINHQMTRVDVGTGSIQTEIGPTSPIKFNKILEFPIYNFPVIKPDIVYDESGFDIELDLSDITILPNTVKPGSSDYILFKIPGVDKELLFRVNNFAYNTIQSNDYYQIDLDIKEIGTNLEEKLKDQIVETYQTIFDNIGTQDKCFLLIEDVEKVTGIVKYFYHFRDMYRNFFYNKQCDSFVLYNNAAYPNYWLYDFYISKFLTDTDIFYEPNSENAIVLTYNAVVPDNMDTLFNRTLLGAILNRSVDYLHPYTYAFQSTITKPFSPFVLNGIMCNANSLHIAQNASTVDSYLSEYYSITLINDIKSGVLTSTDYLDSIIFNYMQGKSIDIDHQKLVSYNFNDDLRTYMYLPIILYIIRQYYDDYFKKPMQTTH